MSGQNGLDLRKYGLVSVDSATSNCKDMGYNHELVFEEKIDLPEMVKVAHEIGFMIELDSVEKDDVPSLYIKSGVMGCNNDVRVHGQYVMYNEPKSFSGPNANRLIFKYGRYMLGWDSEDESLRSIMGCD